MKIFIGTVVHEFGATFFVGNTSDNVKDQLADWCREYWKPEWNDEDGKSADSDTVIEKYFSPEKMGELESAYFGDDDLDVGVG